MDSELQAYRDFFATVSGVGDVCRSKGICHYKWYASYILESTWYNDIYNDYKQLKVEYSERLVQEQKRLAWERKVEELDSDILQKLPDHDGILQSEFVKLFDPADKDIVRARLSNADRNGKITRVKSGRSYILHMKK